MSEKQLVTAIGEPDRINVTQLDGLNDEQWVYGDMFDRMYVYLKNGIVYAIQYKN